MRSVAALLIILAAVVDTAPARACAACACGSQAALPAGAELPFAGRVRSVVALTTTTTTTTDSTGAVTAAAVSLPVGLMVAVNDAVTLDVTVPLGLRLRADTAHGVDGWGAGVGDVVVGARAVWRDRGVMPRLVAGLRVGAMVPTTSVLERADGQPRAEALQPGAAVLAPVIEVTGVWLPTADVALVGGAGGVGPVMSRLPSLEAPSWWLRSFALWRLDERVSVRGGLLGRGVLSGSGHDGADARASLGPEVGVIVDLVTDVAVAATAAVPIPFSGGAIEDGGRAEVAVLVDW